MHPTAIPEWLDPILRNVVEIYFGLLCLTATLFPWWKAFAKSDLRDKKEFAELFDFLGICQLWLISPLSLLTSLVASEYIPWWWLVVGVLFEGTVLVLLARDGHARFFGRSPLVEYSVRGLPLIFFIAKVLVDAHPPHPEAAAGTPAPPAHVSPAAAPTNGTAPPPRSTAPAPGAH